MAGRYGFYFIQMKAFITHLEHKFLGYAKKYSDEH